MDRTVLQPHLQRRRGFTLIEIMVVIGIILILVAVTVAGIAHVATSTKKQRTQTSLEAGRAMWASYIASDSSQAALKQLYSTSAVVCQIDSTLASPFDTSGNAPGCIKATKGPNGDHRWSAMKALDPYLARNVDYTQQVMQVFLRVPENRDIMSKLPAEAKFQITDDNGNPYAIIGLGIVPPLLADGNGEPILFIPPAGMSNVWVTTATSTAATPAYGIIQADGRWHPYPPAVDPIVNLTRTPFFASAGSDRDFTAGDDNAYSVHQ